MLRFRSLTVKFIVISLIVFVILALYFYLDFRFTHRIQGEAARIDIAGRQSMLAMKMMYSAKGILDPLASPAERKEYGTVFNTTVNEYEKTLYSLRDGSEKLGLIPLKEHYKDSIPQLNALIDLWQKTQKPVLLGIKELSPERRNEACVKCHAAMRGNLKDVDAFVKSLVRNQEKEIKDFNALKFSVLGLLLIGTCFIVMYVRRSIIKPVWRLGEAVSKVKLGIFDTRVDIKAEDEIGELSRGFNQMSETLSRSFDENVSLIEKLRENEARLSTLVQTIPDLIWLKDADGVYLACNRMFERFFGAREADVIGKTDYDFVDKELADFFREHDRKAMAAGKPSSNEEWITFADDGHRALLETIKTPMYDAGGKLIGVLGIARDITERRRAEEMIETLHRKNKVILDSAGEGIFGIDLEGIWTFLNPAAADLLGYKPEELLGAERHSLIHHSKHDGAPYPREECLIYAAFKNDTVYHVDNEVFWKKDGTSFPVEYTSTPVREDGKVSGAVVVFKNITARRLAEKTIERYNEELLALADASNVILASADTTAKLYETICEIAARNFNLKMAGLGLVVKDSYEVKLVGQYGLDDGYLKNMKITWDDSLTGMGPTGMAIKTKTVHVVDDMQADTWTAPWREQAVERGIRSTLAAPMITSEGAVIGTINLYSEETHFFTPQRKKMFQVFANQAATAIENARLVEDLEQKVLKRTQEYETANRQLLTTNDELALRRSEAETAKMQADAANRAKSDFLANMSHELRTPLNAIIGFSDIMINGMTGPLTDEQLDFTRDIGKSGKHLLTLINDILDLSKVEAGKMELELATVNIQDLIDRSLVMFKEKAMRHHINVDQRVEDGTTDIIADEMKLKQVLVNLLSNAFKFTPEGGSVCVQARLIADFGLRISDLEKEGRLSAVGMDVAFQSEIRNLKSAIDGDFIEISVADTGPGISPKDILKLFHPFQQLNTTLTSKVSGTGLGLNLCKKFIEMHGGKIWVETEVGKGSTFLFLVPIMEKTK